MRELPFQPIKDGRFVPNRIVELLLATSTHDLNTLMHEGFTDEEHTQFAQLIGYSVGGFMSLSYVSNEDYEVAASLSSTGAPDAVGLQAIGARLAEERRGALRLQLAEVREAAQNIINVLGQAD